MEIYREFEGPVTTIPLAERAGSQTVREQLAGQNYDVHQIMVDNRDPLQYLPFTRFGEIGQALVKGDPLSFDHAFLGMTFVVGATNRHLFDGLMPAFANAHKVPGLTQDELRGPAQTFLTSMAQKETHGTLTAEEIAGMVAAGMMDINYRVASDRPILETGGMGGDKGFLINGQKKKVINASTLSALTLASMGVQVIKHGSYANTSAVGSTEAAEALGIKFHQSSAAEINREMKRGNFYFSDAHVAKTIHDLSHGPFMRHETINHIIGPMTPPVDRDTTLNKVIGVNEGVHPEVVAQAYQILHERGFQKVGNVVAVSGLSAEFDNQVNITNPQAMKSFMMLDEVSPYATLLGVVQNGVNKGSFIVRPEDFGATIQAGDIQTINNYDELVAANLEALSGNGNGNSDYLALNAAIGLLAAEYLDREDAIIDGELNKTYLHEAFQRCREQIKSGKVKRHLDRILDKTPEPGELLKEIDAVIFDVDDTLIEPKSPEFYQKFSEAVNQAVAAAFNISPQRGIEVANYFRTHPQYGGGEHALFCQIEEHFPDLVSNSASFSILYDHMSAVDPSDAYNSHENIVEMITLIKKMGIKVIALTDAPEGLSRKLLAAAGLDPDTLFDKYVAGSREEGPHKLLRGSQKFEEIRNELGLEPQRILAVGDSYKKDVEPALRIGMKTVLVGNQKIEEYKGKQVTTIHEFSDRIAA